MSVWLPDETATLHAGAALAQALQECRQQCVASRVEHAPDPLAAQARAQASGGCHLHLHGGLGAGKTTLVRGMLRAMGVGGAVKSPTYTLVEPYLTAHWEVFHFDLYRLGEAQELELLGARDYFHAGALCVFEWPSKGAGALPAPSLILHLQVEKDGRQLQIAAGDECGRALKSVLEARLLS